MTGPSRYDQFIPGGTTRQQPRSRYDAFVPQETEEEKRQREERERRGREAFRGAGTEGTFEGTPLLERYKRKAIAGTVEGLADIAGYGSKLGTPGMQTAETMLRGTALQQRKKVSPAVTLPEMATDIAGEGTASVAGAMMGTRYLRGLAQGTGLASNVARKLLGPDELSGSLVRRGGQILRQNIGGAVAAAPLVTVPGALAGGQRSTTGFAAQALEQMEGEPGVARRTISRMAETIPGRLAGDIAFDIAAGTGLETVGRGILATPGAVRAGGRFVGRGMDMLRRSFGVPQEAAEVAARETPQLADAARTAEMDAERLAQEAARERLLAETPSPISQAMRQFQEFRAGYGPRPLEIPARPEAPSAPSVREGIDALREPFVGRARAEREIAENAARVEAEREAYRQTVRGAREGQLGAQAEIAAREAQAAADEANAPTVAQRSALERLRGRVPGLGIGIAQALGGAGTGYALGETPEEQAFLATALSGVPSAGRFLPEGQFARMTAESVSALPTLPTEARSFGLPGFIEKPAGYTAASNPIGEVQHRDNINAIITQANPRNVIQNTTQTSGLGLFDDVSPNTIFRWQADATDDEVRRTTAIIGLVRGQEAEMPHRFPRPDDPVMPEGGDTGVTRAIVFTGPEQTPLTREQANVILSVAKQNGLGGATFDPATGRLYFINVKKFTEMGDDQFQDVIAKVAQDVGEDLPVRGEVGKLYAEYLDGPSRFLSVLGDNVEDVRVARDLLDRLAPEYERFAESIGADVTKTRDRLAATRALLDGRIDAIARAEGPLGQMQRELAGVKDETVEIAAARARADTEARLKGRRDRTPVDLSVGTPAQRQMRAVKLGLDDLRDAVKRFGKSASEWYSKQGQQASAQMQALIPELRGSPEKRFVANTILALTSSGATVEDNLARALPIIRQYIKTGQITQLDVSRGVQNAEAMGPLMAEQVGQKRVRQGIWPTDLKGSTRAQAVESGLRKLQLFLDANGGDEKAVRDFFRQTYNTKVGNIPTSADVFGPKVGRFLMNVEGMGGEVTVDSWALRTWMRWMGYGDDARLTFDKEAVTKDNPQGLVLRGGPTPEENAEIRESFTRLARQISKETGENFDPADVQALLWYLEKFNYGKWGSKSELESFADVGNRFVMAGREPMPQMSNVAGTPYTFEFGAGPTTSGLERKATKDYLTQRGAGFRTYDIGGAVGEALKTPIGRQVLTKGGVYGLGDIVESVGEGGETYDESPFLRSTGRAMKGMALITAAYPAIKVGARVGGVKLRDTMAQTPQGRAVLNSISRDILIDPRIREIVENTVTEMARYRAIGRELAAEARKLGPAGDRLVSDLVEMEQFENVVLDPNEMATAVALANRIADSVDKLGLAKVEQGLISQETYQARQRDYLRRIYARYAGEEAMEGVPSGAQAQPFRIKGEKQRLDLSPEQRNELGEIREASYRLTETFGRGGKDIATARMFLALSDLPGVIEPQYKQIFEEAATARALRDAAIASGDKEAARDASRAYLEAKNTLEKMRQTFKKGDEYITLPDTPGLGVLRGAVVRRDAAEYLLMVDDWADTKHVWDKAMNAWKKVHTVYNPGTHTGNFVSNAIITALAGIPLPMQPFYMRAAYKDLKEYGPATRFLTENGILERGLPLYGVTPVKGLAEDKAALRTLARTTRPETREALAKQGIKPMSTAELRVREREAKVTRAYSLEDGFYRVMLFQRYVQDGMEPDAAMKKMMEALPSYDTRSPILKALKNTISPFILFPAKYIPAALNLIMEHPERWVAIAAMWGALNETSRRLYEPVEQADLPPNQRGYNYLIPGRIQVDAIARPAFDLLGIEPPAGDKYTFDVARWTPFSAITGSPAPGAIATQISEDIPGILQPGGPIADIGALMVNRDPFTGEEVIQPGMTGGEKARAVGGRLASLALPSAASFQAPRVIKDILRQDPAAAAVDMMGLVGLRPQVIRPGMEEWRQTKKYEQAVEGIKTRLERELRKSKNPERNARLEEEAAQAMLREEQKFMDAITVRVPR